MIIEKILSLIGIHKYHYCKKYILPWQEFIGHFGGSTKVEELQKWNHYTIHAKWLTHKGECTEMDIKNEENDKQQRSYHRNKTEQ